MMVFREVRFKLRRDAAPLQGLLFVHRDAAPAVFVDSRELPRGTVVTQICRFYVPLDHLRVVLFHAGSEIIAQRDLIGSAGVPQLGRSFVRLERLR